MHISGRDALDNLGKPKASWSTARRRIRSRFVLPLSQRSFSLSTDDTILTLGSCFARNVEEHLAKLGCNVPALSFHIPPEERITERPNEILNLFTPSLFRQEIEWAAEIYDRGRNVTAADCAPMLFQLRGGAADLGLARMSPVSSERFVARRQQLYELYSKAFTADCVIITPGLVEAWFDEKQNRFVNTTPILQRKLIEENRFSVRVLDCGQCYDELRATVEIIRKRNASAKLIISVSPIPLRYTFTDKDVITANQYSKSALVAACQQVCSDAKIDYFPSYEAAIYSSNVWDKDRRHVRDKFVANIVAELEARYFHGANDELPDSVTLNFSHRLRSMLWGVR